MQGIGVELDEGTFGKSPGYVFTNRDRPGAAHGRDNDTRCVAMGRKLLTRLESQPERLPSRAILDAGDNWSIAGWGGGRAGMNAHMMAPIGVHE